MYRLVLCDMDMTLVPWGDQRVSELCLAAMRELADLGVRVGASSGRGTVDLLRQFDGHTWCLDTAVASNGCVVRCDGRELALHELDRAQVERVVEAVRTVKDCFVAVEVPDGRVTVGAPYDEVREHYRFWADFDLQVADELPDIPLLKVTLALPRVAEGDGEARKRNDALVERLRTLCPGIDFCVLGGQVADMMPHGVSKASGLRELMAHLGIPDGEVLVFGDSENDETIMREVPGSVAVANATPPVRELARHHVGPCTEDAVAHALAELARAIRAGEEPAWMASEAEAAALARARTDESLRPERLRAIAQGEQN